MYILKSTRDVAVDVIFHSEVICNKKMLDAYPKRNWFFLDAFLLFLILIRKLFHFRFLQINWFPIPINRPITNLDMTRQWITVLINLRLCTYVTLDKNKGISIGNIEGK